MKPVQTPAPSTPVKFCIQLPDSERGLNPFQIARFDKLKRRLMRSDLKPSQREATLDELAALEHARAQVQDREAIEAGIAEAAELAQAKGEEVVTEKGVTTIRSRDGLHSLYLAEVLTHEQYETAKTCRAAYEARSMDAGAQTLGEGGAGHDNGRFVANRFKRARMLQLIGLVERAIVLQCAREPACLQMFRAVVGEGLSIRNFGSGRAHARHSAALARALDVAEPVVVEFAKANRERAA